MNLSDIKTIEHDVIVVGAGGAGLRAAIECSMKGLSTGLVCKSLLGKAHTVMAGYYARREISQCLAHGRTACETSPRPC